MQENQYSLQDIHDAQFEKIFETLANQDISNLHLNKNEFIDTDCPACLSPHCNFVFNYQDFNYKRCINCELLFISPAPTEEQHIIYLKTSKALAFWRENMSNKIKLSRNNMYLERSAFLMDVIKTHKLFPKEILEVGAGNGELAEILVKQPILNNAKIVLIEPQPLNINNKNIEVINGTLDSIKNNRKFDMIIAFEVLEHILNPSNFLNIVRGLISKDGLFVFSTPNENSFETRTLKTLSSNIFFDHLRLYNPKSIELLLKRHHFEILSITTPGKLDVEMVYQQFHQGNIDLRNNPEIQFILKKENQDKFQKFLVDNLQSSHMRCIAKPT